MSNIQELFDEIIRYYLESTPVGATAAGAHDYDHLLDHADAGYRRQRTAAFREYLKRMSAIKAQEPMSDDETLDYQVLTGQLRAEIFLEEQYRRWERDPSLPLAMALYGCYLLILHDSSPAEQRMQSLLARLEQVPRLLSEAAENLRLEPDVPVVWAEMGEEMAVAAISFFSQVIPSVADLVPSLSESLLQATAGATEACAGFLGFLKEKLTNRSRGTYAVGGDGFAYLSKHLHALPYSGEDLDRIGTSVIEETLAEMDKLAARINPKATREEVVAALKLEVPEEDDLLGYYQRLVEKARQHLIDHDLMTLPKDDKLRFVETPVFARSTYPYAAYAPPPPLDAVQQGFFWVTPIDSEASPEVQGDQRVGHNKYQASLVALHEAYPGHHLQFYYGNRVASNVRKLFSTSVFVEGWALYCEQMMYETGYFADDKSRLMQLNGQLWRACRVVIDVALHNGEMSFSDAVTVLTGTAGMERLAAIAEVKRYSQSPTQPMSYIVGKIEILKLREDYRRQMKDEFQLKAFHDQLLSYGAIPISLIRKMMLEQK